MSLPAEQRRLTLDEYLRMEQASPTRHEYHDGQIFDMSGGSYEHSLIITNTSAALHGALAGKPCRVLDSNLKIGIPSSGRFVYPDAQVRAARRSSTRETLRDRP
jgi:Uma2 family endonuclease